MIVQIRLFAVARQLAGSDLAEIQLPETANVADARAALVQAYPPLAPLKRYLAFAVNAEYAADDRPIRAGDEIACLPPVSGG